MKQRKGCRISRAHSYSHNKAHSPTFQSFHLRHNSFSNPSVALPTSQLIHQPFSHFTYVTTHSPTLPSLYLRHSSFTNLSVTSPTSQLISVALPTSQLFLQPFRCFTYATVHSPNTSFASPTSQALHLIHVARRPWHV